MSLLFSSLQIREVTFRNRIAISPMCQYSATDGFANDWHFVHLGSRATGGAGLVIQEATAVSAEGRISPKDLGIWSDEHIPALKRIVGFIHDQGSMAGIQLAHAGRKASHDVPWKSRRLLLPEEGGWERVAPSPLSFHHSEPTVPRELSPAEINTLKKNFLSAAERAVEAGYRVIELHAAHGYLLHQFLSPLTNKRTDEYGGSFENRSRLLLEITKEVRTILGDARILFVRISATDWAEGGWDLEQSIRLSGILKSLGVDLIDCSSGGAVSHQKITVGPGYQVPFAEEIKKQVQILTGAVGLITGSKQAEEILQKQQADLILIARESLRDPHFPLRAARELGYEISWPVQYERAM